VTKPSNASHVTPAAESLIKEARAFHLKKRLGQHLLVSPDVLATIVNAIEAKPGDCIVEVGSGIGFLTRLLSATGAKIVAVDLDRESVEQLEALQLPNVEIKHGDILRFNLEAMDFFRKRGQNDEDGAPTTRSDVGRLKVIGNVPYQITGLILGHILGEINQPSPWLHRIDNIVLTVQYEVAQRLVANAGDREYSKVSLLIRHYCEPELIEQVPADAFYPPPKVHSAVVRLRPRSSPAVQPANPQLMQKLIEAGFRQRRKMFRNSISFLKLSPGEIDSVFRHLHVDPQVRAERLSLQQFAMLADAFDDLLKKDDGQNDKGAGAGENQPDI
jgi:16S rRNA (adenine1518-N6/adenine1519-N6)-dimethyltransferase